MPHCQDKYSSINIICHSPADNWFAVYVDKNGKGRTLDVNMPQGLYSLEFYLKVKNFLSCHSAESPLALLFRLTGPRLIWTKKVRGPPGGSLWVWRHFSILFALWATPEQLLDGRIQRDCWPQVLQATAPWWLTGTALLYADLSFHAGVDSGTHP